MRRIYFKKFVTLVLFLSYFQFCFSLSKGMGRGLYGGNFRPR